jgi:hypothetical protein
MESTFFSKRLRSLLDVTHLTVAPSQGACQPRPSIRRGENQHKRIDFRHFADLVRLSHS